TRAFESSRRGHFALDSSGVFLEGPRLRRELDDPLLPVERVLAPDVHVVVGDLDQVVTGSRLAAQAMRGDRAGVDHEEVFEPPGVRNVLVAGEDDVHARALQALDRVARVVDDVPLASGARDRKEMVVQYEDPKLRATFSELLL